ncbi:unnamed protein product [Leuciscus chuanchicus]
MLSDQAMYALIPAALLSESELTILEVNIRGLRSNIGDLANCCSVKKPSIVIVVETFLDSTTPDGADSIQIPGYSLNCRRDRTGKNGGGIAVYCLEGISIYHNPARDPDDFELMWFTVALKTRTLLIGAIYRPPSASCDILDYLDKNTFSVMDEYRAQSVMLGDFNVHHHEWLGSNKTDTAGRRASQLTNCLGLDQIVMEPTRGDNILDLVLSDTPATTTTLAQMGSSDHNPVLVQLQIPVLRDKPYKRTVWRYDKAHFWEMRGYLTNINWPSILKDEDPEIICTNFTTILRDAMALYIPNKTISKKPGDKAWFNAECRRLAMRKRKLYHNIRTSDDPAMKREFLKARAAFNQA